MCLASRDSCAWRRPFISGIWVLKFGSTGSVRAVGSREARARADVAETRANLDRAVGATIEAHGISVTF